MTTEWVTVPRALEGSTRQEIANIVETVARDGLVGPRDLDVALDAIGCAITDGASPVPPSEPVGWQPIETAPKDQFVLLYSEKAQYVAINRWGQFREYNNPRFSHWMPLPPAPGSAEGLPFSLASQEPKP